jgi:hypothetical protein
MPAGRPFQAAHRPQGINEKIGTTIIHRAGRRQRQSRQSGSFATRFRPSTLICVITARLVVATDDPVTEIVAFVADEDCRHGDPACRPDVGSVG